MTYRQFTIPPQSRAVGTVNPPGDDNNLAGTVSVTHAFNLLNSAYGTCDPSGALDSTAAINAGLAACTAGQRAFLPAGQYLVSAPLVVPPGVMLEGEYANEVSTYLDGYIGTCLIVSASWAPVTVGANTYSGVITLLGQTVPSPNYALPNTDAKVRGIYVDGHLGPAGVTGVQCYGAVLRPHFERVDVSHVTGNGFDFVNDSAGNGPDAPRLRRCTARNAGGTGFNHVKISDATYDDCLAESGASHGFFVQNASNGKFIACRSEHNGTAGAGDGFHHLQTSASTGSGGCLYVGCSTDRNEGNGFSVQSSNSTGVPVTLAGCDFRRDGRNGNAGGAGLAGVLVTAFPGTVLMTGVNVFPGVDDNGAGANSPQNGLRISGNAGGSGTFVFASGCWFQGDANAVFDDGSALFQDLSGSGRATGTTAAPGAKMPFTASGTLTLEPTGDTTGAADSLKISSALAMLVFLGVPGTITLAQGNWFLASPVPMGSQWLTVQGTGNGTLVQDGSAWSGTALFQPSASNQRITRMRVQTAAAGFIDFGGSTILDFECDHVTVTAGAQTSGNPVASPDVFQGAVVKRSFFHDLNITQWNPAKSIWTQAPTAGGGVLATTIFRDCLFQVNVANTPAGPGGTLRSVPAISVATTTNKNIDGLSFEKCFFANGFSQNGNFLDNSQYFVDISTSASGSGQDNDNIVFRDCISNQCLGGVIRVQSAVGVSIENLNVGNVFAGQGTPNLTAGNSFVRIQKNASSITPASCVRITGYQREIGAAGFTGTSDPSDISVQADTSNIYIESPRVVDGNTPLQVNLNGAAGAVLVNLQPGAVVLGQNAAAGQATVIIGNGQVTVGGAPLGGAGGTDWVNVVTQFGADPSGTLDSTAAISNALAAAAPGQPVYLPAGKYKVTATISLPAGAVLIGDGGPNPHDAGDAGTVIVPAASFAGTSVLFTRDTAGHAGVYGPAVRSLAIDGSAYTATALAGILAFGPVFEASLIDVGIANMSGWGILTAQDTSATGPQWPFEWHADRVTVFDCAAGGISLTSMTDATWRDVYVLNCGKGATPGPGWMINWAGNSHFTGCRGEWSGTNGFHLTGAWWTGAGSGGMTMTGCSTDRNEKDGVLVDATGNGPLLITNLMCRRDGRNNKTGGGGFSGFNIAAATIPVIVGTISVYPGADDDGTGANSPQNGISVSGGPIATIGGGYVQAATTAINDTHGSGFFWISPAMITATGTPSAPGSYVGQQAYGFTEFAQFAEFKSPIFADAGIDVDVAGQGLAVKEGPNAKQGAATLAAGSVTVANTSVTATSKIWLSRSTAGGTLGHLSSTISPGVSFTISSSSATETSTINYEIIEPG